MACRQAPDAHLLFQNRRDDLGLHGDGILVIGIVAGKVKRRNVVLAVRGDLDDLAAQRLCDGAVLAFGVNDNYIVLRAEYHFHDGVFHAH